MRQLETLKEEVSRGVLHHYRNLMRNSRCLQFKGSLGDFFLLRLIVGRQTLAGGSAGKCIQREGGVK